MSTLPPSEIVISAEKSALQKSNSVHEKPLF